MISEVILMDLSRVLTRAFLILLLPMFFGCATDSALQRTKNNEQHTNEEVAHIEKQLVTINNNMDSLQSSVDKHWNEEKSQQDAIEAVAVDAKNRSDHALARTRYLRGMISLALNHPVTQSPDSPAQYTEMLMRRLIKQARKAALAPYIRAPRDVPASLDGLDETTFNNITWSGKLQDWPQDSPFALAFQPTGYLYAYSINVNLVTGPHTETLRFVPGDFRFPTQLRNLPSRLRVAGIDFFHALYPHGKRREFLSFLGASYFRALGNGQWWGLSARGVAINTAVRNTQEEFPAFKSYWIITPAMGAESLTVLASLSGPSVTGVYKFVVTPGETTQTRVTAVLYLRNHIKRLGLAPLTSMFLQGPASHKEFDELHPSIHDSDGLQIEKRDGTWIWQPLVNPDWLRVTRFPLNNPIGFGLMQRDREFETYQSLNEHYQNRPSAWVTFIGKCGHGHVDLIEIPSSRRSDDNIVAFWEPRDQPQPGEPLVIHYNIAWQGSQQTLPPLGWTSHTSVIWPKETTGIYSIYFTGGDLVTLPSWVKLQADIQVGKGASVTGISLVKLPENGLWRLRFTMHGNKQVSVSAHLAYHSRPLTENWDYGT